MCRDSQTENHLSHYHVPYTYMSSIPVSKIDVKGMLASQPRIDKCLDEDKVDAILAAMRNGVCIGAPVFVRNGDMFKLNNGTHRMGAMIKGKFPSTDGYILETNDPALTDFIAVTLNAIQGRAYNRQETQQHILDLRKRHNMSIEALAKGFSLSPDTISDILSADNAWSRYNEIAGQPLRVRSRSTLAVLNRIKDPEVFRKAVDLVSDANLDIHATTCFVRETRQSNSVPHQLATVKMWATRPEIKARIENKANGKQRMPRSKATQVIKLITEAVNIFASNPEIGMTPDERLVFTSLRKEFISASKFYVLKS